MSLRLAMWSGPRNISTTMMRSWEARGDCAVVDEPLYAHYLAHTGLDHPGRDAIIAAGPADWREAVAGLLGPVPGDQPVFYQKHMTHHLLPHIGTDWFGALRHVFLIRHPREVVLSYARVRADITPADIGAIRQHEIYQEVTRQTGSAPPVVDAGEFLKNPEAQLRALCQLLGLEFTPRMLHWPPGRRASDGVWAPYWYAAVETSTGFEPYRERAAEVPAQYRAVVEQSLPAYEALYACRLRG